MGKYEKNIRTLLFGALFLYALNKYVLGQVIHVSFMKNHFNDCIAGIVMICLLNELHLFWFKTKCSDFKALLILFMAALFWEYITPLYLTKSVSDIKDVVAYMAGGVCGVMILKICENNKGG